MSVPDRSLDPKILESAKKEFLANGFEKTSLKAICDGAGVTTGALYKRYDGKEGLFTALVAPTLRDLNSVIEEKSNLDVSTLTDKELIDAWNMQNGQMEWWFQYLNEAVRRGLTTIAVTKEELHILLSAFWSTIYEPFIHSFTWEQIEEHCKIVCNLFDWYKTFGMTLAD